jgi:hypothetical protein
MSSFHLKVFLFPPVATLSFNQLLEVLPKVQCLAYKSPPPPVQNTLSYSVAFKVQVVRYVKQNGMRAAERHFGPLPAEKMIRVSGGKKKSLDHTRKNKTFFSHARSKMASSIGNRICCLCHFECVNFFWRSLSYICGALARVEVGRFSYNSSFIVVNSDLKLSCLNVPIDKRFYNKVPIIRPKWDRRTVV